MDNLKIYNQAKTVPQEAQKPINAGRLKGMTDINPMWRIKRLTEIFGPCGVGWWYEITGKRIEYDEATKQRAAFVDINLYYINPDTGENSHAIPGTGGASFVAQERNGPYLSDECFKMALTDAISVSAKALGVGADVYFAKDRDKYNSAPASSGEAPPPPAPPPQREDPLFRCERCGATLIPYKDGNGKEVSLRKHSERSKAKFGATLCMDCIRRVLNENAG